MESAPGVSLLSSNVKPARIIGQVNGWPPGLGIVEREWGGELEWVKIERYCFLYSARTSC